MTAPASRTAPTPAVQPRRRRYSSWRPTSALAVVVVALVAGQAIAFAVELLAGGADDKIDGVTAISLILADVVMIAVVIAFARRGTERLTAATLGIRRTAFGPALSWILAIYFGVIALEGLYALLITALGAGGVERQDVGSPGAPSTLTAIATLLTARLHAINNAIAAGVLLGGSRQVPLGVLGAVAAVLFLLAPFARERAPQTA